MTYEELVLLRRILERVKEGKKVSLSDDQKIDTDSLYNYFDNVITHIEKDKIRNPKIEYQAIRLWVDVSKVRGVEDVKERVDEKEKDSEKVEEGKGKQPKNRGFRMGHTQDGKIRDHSKEKKKTKVV